MNLLGKHSHSENENDFAFYNMNPTNISKFRKILYKPKLFPQLLNTNIIVNMIVITSSSTYQKVTHIKMNALKIASCRKLDVSAPGSYC